MDDSLINFIKGFQEKPTSRNAKPSENELRVFDKALMYGILAPTIVDERWPEIADELKFKAKAWRMKNSLQCIKEEMATEFDAMVYLHTASLAAPFTGHWYNIYFYLFRKYFPQQAEQLNIDVQELDRYEKTLLNELRSWIFKHQINAIKHRTRGEMLYTGLFSYFIRLDGVILPVDSIPQINRILLMNRLKRPLN